MKTSIIWASAGLCLATLNNDLKLAIKNTDAILVTLGTNGKIKATTLFSEFAKYTDLKLICTQK